MSEETLDFFASEEEQVFEDRQVPEEGSVDEQPARASSVAKSGPVYDSQIDRLIDVASHCRSEVRVLRSSLFAGEDDSAINKSSGGLFGRGKQAAKIDTSPQILSDALDIVIETLEEASLMLENLSEDVKIRLGNRRL